MQREAGLLSVNSALHATIAPYGPFDVANGTSFFNLQNERE
ncbi:hypothetical protein AB0K08_16275 [Citricoccus sp. NPDC055426]